MRIILDGGENMPKYKLSEQYLNVIDPELNREHMKNGIEKSKILPNRQIGDCIYIFRSLEANSDINDEIYINNVDFTNQIDVNLKRFKLIISKLIELEFIKEIPDPNKREDKKYEINKLILKYACDLKSSYVLELINDLYNELINRDINPNYIRDLKYHRNCNESIILYLDHEKL